MTRSLTLRRLVPVLLLLPALGACSMASFSGIKPAPSTVASNSMPPPQAQAVLSLEGAPVPAMRPDTSEAFVPFAFAEAPARAGSVDGLIAKYASVYQLPESLVRRVVAHESGFNPGARNGAYLGLMQISHSTARTMGYRGPASGLLDAETNLKYGVKYLRGAYLVASFNSDNAIRYCRRGYYYDAKRLGLLEEAGFR